jgi:hypothetical protein
VTAAAAIALTRASRELTYPALYQAAGLM